MTGKAIKTTIDACVLIPVSKRARPIEKTAEDYADFFGLVAIGCHGCHFLSGFVRFCLG